VNNVHSLQADLKGKAMFVTIYIAEAHAQDQWPLGRHVTVLQPKTLEERIKIATGYVQKFNYQIPLVVDDMSNNFMNTYWAHPERFFVIDDGKLMLKGQPREDGWYVFDDIRDYVLNREKEAKTAATVAN